MTCVTALAGDEVIKDSQGMDCFVYTSDPVDAAKTYQLVVGADPFDSMLVSRD